MKLDKEEYQDEKGNVVSDHSKALGLPVTHPLLYPHFGLMADKMGNNTNTTKDKTGRRYFYTGCQHQPFIYGSNDDQHFTVLGFTNFAGEPVLAVILIAKDIDLSFEEMYGVNPDTPWRGAEDDLFSNVGPNCRYPGGPTYVVNGVHVPAIVTSTKNGGINGTVLTKCLFHLDKGRVMPHAPNFLIPSCRWSWIPPLC